MVAFNYDDPQDVIQSAFNRGWFFDPLNPNGHNVKQSELHLLNVREDVVQDALRTGSHFQWPEYAASVQNIHRRGPDFDGVLGPSMKEMLRVDRCGNPDFAPAIGVNPYDVCDNPVLCGIYEKMQNSARHRENLARQRESEEAGSGSWRGCHGVGAEFHSAIMEIDMRNLPAKMKETDENGRTVLWHVLNRTQVAYAKHGLLWLFRVDGKDYLTGKVLTGTTNNACSFVTRSSGWIGLAIVDTGLGCGQTIWLKFLATYRPGDYIRQWFTLFSHEGGHNCGSGHISGDPVMHPSIRSNSPWLFNPSSGFARYLDRAFGATDVDIPGGKDPKPDPKPDPVQDQLDKHEFRLDLHEMLLRNVLAKS